MLKIVQCLVCSVGGRVCDPVNSSEEFLGGREREKASGCLYLGLGGSVKLCFWAGSVRAGAIASA